MTSCLTTCAASDLVVAMMLCFQISALTLISTNFLWPINMTAQTTKIVSVQVYKSWKTWKIDCKKINKWNNGHTVFGVVGSHVLHPYPPQLPPPLPRHKRFPVILHFHFRGGPSQWPDAMRMTEAGDDGADGADGAWPGAHVYIPSHWGSPGWKSTTACTDADHLHTRAHSRTSSLDL